jgi:hypothetical protein
MSPMTAHARQIDASDTLGAVAVGTPLLDGQAPVLACIPNLNGLDTATHHHRSDGRLFNQRLSNRLLVGGAIVVALAAVIPFLPVHRSRQVRLRPIASAAPAWTTTAASTPVASAVQLHAMPESHAPAALPPMAMSNTASSVAPIMGSHATTALSGTNRPMALADARGSASAAVRREPDPIYPNSLRSGGENGFYRNELRPAMRSAAAVDYQNQYPDSRGVHGDALMPAADVVEPGVARLEGTITKPPIRSPYDAVGPSIH